MTAVGLEPASPYPGLASFGDSEADALFFFGRERETEIVTASLIASRLTVLYGPSGVGKSSLVRAGVARRVRELAARRAVARGLDLVCVVFAAWAVEDSVAALADAVAAAVRPLVTPLAPDPPPGAGLADAVEHWSVILDGDVCLVLDQLEEYFVYHRDGPGSLVEQLPELVQRPGLRANVLLSIRDDELARLGALRSRLPQVFANARRLERLDRDAARAAIVGPLRRWNELEPAAPVEIEPELVDAVLQQAATADRARVEAPYLQLVMERVWSEEAAEGSRVLRRSTLERLGGAEEIVRDHLGRAIAVLDTGQQAAAARMFAHLVTPSGTKIAHRAADLAAFSQLDDAASRDLLATLGRERILRPLDDGGAGGRYELFHDVLAKPIVDWSRDRAVAVERAKARRRQHRLVAVAVGALAAVAVMAAVTVYALVQRGHATTEERHQRAAALAAGALAELPADPELGLLLARRAVDYRRSPAIEDVLRTALQASRARGVLRGHAGGVVAVGFSGRRVLTVDGGGTLRAFPARTSRPVSTEALGGRIRAVAFAAGGSALAIAHRRLVEVKALDPGGRSFAVRAPAPVRAVAIDRVGDRVAIALADGRIDVRTAAGELARVRASFDPRSLALDALGRTLAAGAAGGRIEVWRLGRHEPTARIDAGSDLTAVALSPDGSLLAAAGADGAARLWRAKDGRFTAVAVAPTPLTTVVFSPDGRALLAGSTDGSARIFDVGDGSLLAVLARHRDAVTAAAFSPGGTLLVTGGKDGIARIWDPGVAPELRLVARPADCCTALARAPGGVLVAAGTRALRYAGSRLAGTYRQPVRVTAVATTGATVVTGGVDGRVRVWRTTVGPALTLALGTPVGAVAATPTAVVAGGRDGSVRVWSSDGRPLLAFREPSAVTGVAVSPDGRLLATAGLDAAARIRDFRTGRLLHELEGHSKPLTAVAFSPDGRLLATSSFDHDVRIWDVATGRQTHLLRAHFAVVSDVAFSADGRWLVSAGPTTAGLWQPGSGTFLTYLHGHTGRVVGAVFADGDRDVVTASVDGTIRSYRCSICGGVGELVRLADARLHATGRALTPEERRRYVSS